MQRITTLLTFKDQAGEAVEFYTSIFENSRIVSTSRYGEAGPGPASSLMSATFELAGQTFYALNGGPSFEFSQGISLSSDATRSKRSTSSGKPSRRAARRARAAGWRTSSASPGRSSPGRSDAC